MNQRPPALEIPVSLVRDYHQINRELIRALDAGHPLIRLTDVEGQRLLAAGLRGPWSAVIEILGDAGPELAAELDAPGVSILCEGSAADGAGRGVKAGRLAIRDAAGDALGVMMRGGTIVVAGPSGHRAGLRQRGGALVLLGGTGHLLADRQTGGIVFAGPEAARSIPGRGRIGGRLVNLPGRSGSTDAMPPDDASALAGALDGLPGHIVSGCLADEASG